MRTPSSLCPTRRWPGSSKAAASRSPGAPSRSIGRSSASCPRTSAGSSRASGEGAGGSERPPHGRAPVLRLHHRAQRCRQELRDQVFRGHGLLLRRQSAHDAHPNLRRSHRPVGADDPPRGPGRGCQRRGVPLPSARRDPRAQSARPWGRGPLPRGERGGARPALPREPPPPPAGGRRQRPRGHSRRAQGDVADRIVDTSALTVHQLKELLVEHYVTPRTRAGLATSLVSFGFKHGVPFDADLVFDVRFLPNPHFVPGLRPFDGRDARVREFVLGNAEGRELLEHLKDFLKFLLPRYEREGKAYLTIAIGCTGGRHRSVTLTEELKGFLDELGYAPTVAHRDLEKE